MEDLWTVSIVKMFVTHNTENACAHDYIMHIMTMRKEFHDLKSSVATQISYLATPSVAKSAFEQVFV